MTQRPSEPYNFDNEVYRLITEITLPPSVRTKLAKAALKKAYEAGMEMGRIEGQGFAHDDN